MLKKCIKARVRKLVKELRDGNRTQTTGCLKDSCGECCLGVATDIYINSSEGKRNHARWESGTQTFFSDRCKKGECEVLPPEVRDYYGFRKEKNPKLVYDDEYKEQCPASELNDIHKLPFDEIADAFERTYLKGVKKGK